MTGNISPPSTRTSPSTQASTGAQNTSSKQTQRVSTNASFLSAIKNFVFGQTSIGQPDKARLETAPHAAGPAMQKFKDDMTDWCKQSVKGSGNRWAAARAITTWLDNGDQTSLLLNRLNLDSTPPDFEKIDEIRRGNGGTPLSLLDLSENRFGNLSLSFDKFSQLEELNLGSCELPEVPDSIGSLKNLRKLNLGNNGLTSIPDKIFSPNLKTLHIQINKIKEIPTAISNAVSLEHLYATRTNIKCLPESITSLKKLVTVDVRGCAITQSLPEISGTYRS
ncbi:leucine-rich repeat domain-containing protein [Paraburkholderia sediminicola]|uniref:leucine-rich repeat domain-containing protein n=1 Tax=Paraburkholderia sediminicola TaxID=458836 RepID=UPI0038BCA5A5